MFLSLSLDCIYLQFTICIYFLLAFLSSLENIRYYNFMYNSHRTVNCNDKQTSNITISKFKIGKRQIRATFIVLPVWMGILQSYSKMGPTLAYMYLRWDGIHFPKERYMWVNSKVNRVFFLFFFVSQQPSQFIV